MPSELRSHVNNRCIFYSQKLQQDVIYRFVQRFGCPKKMHNGQKTEPTLLGMPPTGRLTPGLHLARSASPGPLSCPGCPQKESGLRNTFHRKP